MRDAPFLDFPLPEYERRLAAVQAGMRGQGFDLLVLTLRENVEYLCGFTTVSWRLTDKAFWLVLPAAGAPAFLCDPIHTGNAEETCCVEDVRLWGPGGTTAVDLLEAYLKEHPGQGAVGLETGVRERINMSVPDYHAVCGLAAPRPIREAGPAVARARRYKSPEEVRRLREACRITEEVIGEVFPHIEPGMTERGVVRDLVTGFAQRGADSPLNTCTFGYMGVNGGRLSQMNPVAVDRPLDRGDLVRHDGGCVYRNYSADISRNTVVGAPPSEEIQRACEACDAVMDATIAAIRPGVTSAELCRASVKAMEKAGYDDKRRFTMDRISAKAGSMIGHAIGFAKHEDPFITPTDQTVWETNMTGAVEFGLGEPEYGYADFEDNFVVTEEGCEVMSPGPRFVDSATT
jgi:Xaa-Pro dipeptidase